MTDSSHRHLRAVDASAPPENRTSGPVRRRSLLQPGLTGAGAGVALSGAGVTLALASSAAVPAATAGPDVSRGQRPGRVRPDGESPRFTIAVIPDTQHLFDGASLHPEPLAASVEAILARAALDNVVLVAHLGDVVQNGAARRACWCSPWTGGSPTQGWPGRSRPSTPTPCHPCC